MANSPLLISLLIVGQIALAAPASDKKKAQALETFLNSEKPNYEKRQVQRKDTAEALDKLNSDQNQVRQKIMALGNNRTELSMALENLALEFQQQKQLEQMQRQRLAFLLKVVYKIKQEGMIRFVFDGRNLSQLAGRIRILYRTLRSHTQITQQLEERARRLAESEGKLTRAKAELNGLLDDLKDQEDLLSHLLKQKKQMLADINKKQNSYETAAKEYKKVSAKLAQLFNSLPSALEPKTEAPKRVLVAKGNLPVPVSGHILKGFGKSIHEKFGTVTFHKGLEIAAEFNAPVVAILPGLVEYAGGLRGLGNVMILHHGGGLYTLSANLFKNTKEVGAKVEQGETIGLVGDTGNSENPSLYFEIREHGKAVDPLAYFSRSASSTLN